MLRKLSKLLKSQQDANNTGGFDSAEIIKITARKQIAYYATLDSLPFNSLVLGQRAFVEENKRVYISNGSGWYNYRVVNINPILSLSSNSVTFYESGGNEIIIATAIDSDNPVSIINVDSDGSFGGMATLSQDSSVFTITPLGDITTETSDLTFSVTDGINTAVQTLSCTSLVPTLNLTVSDTSGDEGSSVTVSIATTNFVNGPRGTGPIPYTITGVSSADI